MSYSPSSSRVHTTASFPFNRKDADTILRSTDAVDFRVHRAILELSSSFFADGSDALDKRNVGMTSPEDGGLPIAYVYTDSHTLDLILRHIYPLPTPDVRDIDVACAALHVAREYEFALVASAMKKAVLRLAEANPLQVYARASLRACHDEMRLAARISLRHPILELYAPELEEISGATYHRLLTYHRLCGRVAAAVVENFDWAVELCEGEHTPVWFTCQLCPSLKLETVSNTEDPYATSWFHTLLLTFKQALRARPCGSTVYNPECAESSLAEAMACSACRTTALSDFRRFTALLKEEVNRAVSQVQIEIPKLYSSTHP